MESYKNPNKRPGCRPDKGPVQTRTLNRMAGQIKAAAEQSRKKRPLWRPGMPKPPK